jgi:hypothetical protein
VIEDWTSERSEHSTLSDVFDFATWSVVNASIVMILLACVVF